MREAAMTDKIIQEELNRIGSDPILPIEMKLIGWSLGIGLVLLVILSVISRLG